MKKLFLGLGLVAGTFAFAQTSPTFGLKAGLNVSSISDDGYEDSKAKAGFYGGIFMNAPISEMFSIQPEVLYSQMGAKITERGSGTVAGSDYSYRLSSSTNLDYITVPVMFQFNATPNFYLEAGPEFGFLISAKARNSSYTNVEGNFDADSYDSDSRDIKDNFSGFNMGAALGLGFNFTQNFGINARYVAGFTDISKKNNGEDGNTTLEQSGKNRNNAFQVGLSYKF
ncbi:outer membrane beta-barrel protein [Epilithonimonas sp. JDS]|uniref:porin family protein n=1 Tax=Epilithonimonas sp. JDS TaxID=2902797 RepID=UPI001E30611D|nr:porin family protein [Epilithonimonas sp. JDS]MCD9854852.1 outer membrane beta-barrel protein [Epilithonimonas sp. JDS]